MENKDMKEITKTLAKSLSDTQKNATDTEKLVQQVCRLSDPETHRQVIAGIMSDRDTNLEKKIELVQKANSDYDQREENNTRRMIALQSMQTQNVEAATGWWAENLRWVAVGGIILIGIATPNGRKALSSATKHLLTV